MALFLWAQARFGSLDGRQALFFFTLISLSLTILRAVYHPWFRRQFRLRDAGEPMQNATTPQVFLFHEPTSALDLRRQLELMALIEAETRARNITSLVALHDLNLACRFADEMILMRRGKVLAQGAPDTVLAHGQVAETYGVGLDIVSHPRGGLHVSAYL